MLIKKKGINYVFDMLSKLITEVNLSFFIYGLCILVKNRATNKFSSKRSHGFIRITGPTRSNAKSSLYRAFGSLDCDIRMVTCVF